MVPIPILFLLLYNSLLMHIPVNNYYFLLNYISSINAWGGAGAPGARGVGSAFFERGRDSEITSYMASGWLHLYHQQHGVQHYRVC